MPVRRTQEERSASTRARLLEATVDCLADLGYARTTTTEVAGRAGVSRGAQLHHYPTRARLVTAAVAHLFDRREQEFRRALAHLPAGRARSSAAVDLLWSMLSGRTFSAWLELTVAARTDTELRRAMRTLHRRTSRNIERTFRDLFAPPVKPSPVYDLVPAFAFAVLQGLALDQIGDPDAARRRRVLDALKELSPLFLPEEAA